MKKTLQLSKKQNGYVLFLVMLLIGSLGLYLTYQFSLQKIKSQSWQVQKTVTEMSYWMDIERNYLIDNNINTTSSAGQDQQNAFTLPEMIFHNYLPYGQYRPVTFQSTALTQVSEFLCSPLPGVNTDEGALTLDAHNATCPQPLAGSYNYTAKHCSLDDISYYSCGNAMIDATKLPVTMRKAQYYINANNISIGNYQAVLAGLGLIIRTPGTANPYIQYTGGQMGQLPNGSTAQALISLLPGSAFNVYSTTVSGVNGIGIGTYLSADNNLPKSTVIKNDRYSKIIDMGSVQAVNLTNPNCCGWKNNAKKNADPYDKGGNTGNKNKCTSTNNSHDPPNCIQFNSALFGSSGSIETCGSIDVLYTMIDNYQENKKPWYLNYTQTRIATSGSNSYFQVFLSSKSYTGKTLDNTSYLENKDNHRKNRFAYIVRCRREPP